MQENEYRSAYKSLNPHKCVFEKAINSRQCSCDASTRFNLADREGVACADALLQQRCTQYLETTREKVRFSLQLTQAKGPLPHAKEIRVQLASVSELHKLLGLGEDVPNIRESIATAIERFGDIEHFPFTEITKAVSQFPVRKKRQRR